MFSNLSSKHVKVNAKMINSSHKGCDLIIFIFLDDKRSGMFYSSRVYYDIQVRCGD